MIRGNEIRIKVPESWDEADVKVVFDRVARMLTHNQNEAVPQAHGYAFVLNESSNDWWGKFDAETGELVIAYRYGHGREKELSALETVVRWFLGLEEK